MSFATSGIYSMEEFLARQSAGDFNPDRTYEEYLDWRRRIEEKARREYQQWLAESPNPEYGAGDEGEELTEEDEAILDRAWAALRVEEVQKIEAEKKTIPAARAA